MTGESEIHGARLQEMVERERRNLGKWIRRERENRSWTQLQLSNRIGKTKAAIAQIESGVLTPGNSTLEKICDQLEMDRDEAYFVAEVARARTEKARRIALYNLETHRNYAMHQSELKSLDAKEQGQYWAREYGRFINEIGGEKTGGDRLVSRRVGVPVFDAQGGPAFAWSDGGYPVGAAGDFEYMISDMVDENSFVLIVHGESMAPGLPAGARVLVVPSEPLENGKLCFAAFPGEDGDRMVKRYYRYGENIVLRSDNPAYTEISLDRDSGRGVRIYRVTWVKS